MIAFRVSKRAATPVFVCDLCHQVIPSPDDGNVLAIDARTHELLAGWMIHKDCDRQMREILPFTAATLDLGSVARSLIKHSMSKIEMPFPAATVEEIKNTAAKIQSREAS
jgi:hypothetical protein